MNEYRNLIASFVRLGETDGAFKRLAEARPLLTKEQLAEYAGRDEPQFFGDISLGILADDEDDSFVGDVVFGDYVAVAGPAGFEDSVDYEAKPLEAFSAGNVVSFGLVAYAPAPSPIFYAQETEIGSWGARYRGVRHANTSAHGTLVTQFLIADQRQANDAPLSADDGVFNRYSRLTDEHAGG